MYSCVLEPTELDGAVGFVAKGCGEEYLSRRKDSLVSKKEENKGKGWASRVKTQIMNERGKNTYF